MLKRKHIKSNETRNDWSGTICQTLGHRVAYDREVPFELRVQATTEAILVLSHDGSENPRERSGWGSMELLW